MAEGLDGPVHGTILVTLGLILRGQSVIVTTQCCGDRGHYGNSIKYWPVAFASRALTETESRYAQIEKELLALVYVCTKFHHYIYGRAVTVETDHQPLITILKKPLHTASARIQRLMLRCSVTTSTSSTRGAGSTTSLMLSPVHICPPLTTLRKRRSTRSWWWMSSPHT